MEPTRSDEDDLLRREASYGRGGFLLQFMLNTTLSDAERYPPKLSDTIVIDVNREAAPIRIIWASRKEQIIHAGLDLHEGLTISKETSHLLLIHDVAGAAAAVDRLVHMSLTENQQFALTSFVFRFGEGRFRDSTLLRPLNQGDYASVPAQLMRWNMETVNSVLSASTGLTNRCKAEAKLWVS